MPTKIECSIGEYESGFYIETAGKHITELEQVAGPFATREEAQEYLRKLPD